MGTTRAQFQAVLDRFAQFWGINEPLKTLPDYTDDVFWAVLPDQLSWQGKPALAEAFKEFQANLGDGSPITWHKILYDEADQYGITIYSSEFPPSAAPARFAHGTIWWQMRDGLIAEYREQFNYTDKPWDEWNWCRGDATAEGDSDKNSDKTSKA